MVPGFHLEVALIMKACLESFDIATIVFSSHDIQMYKRYIVTKASHCFRHYSHLNCKGHEEMSARHWLSTYIGKRKKYLVKGLIWEKLGKV